MNPRGAPARFSDRLVAFFCDGLLAFGVYFGATLLAATRAPEILARPLVASLWPGLALAFYCAYHAALAARGRRTLGKRLLGLRVAREDGSELSGARALARAAASLLSGAAAGLGFLAALGSARAAWHDRLCGTRVFQTREKSRAERVAAAVLAWPLGAAILASWLWLAIGAPRHAQRQLVANAQFGLQALARLEHAYKRTHGAYAPNLESLLAATGRADELKAELAKLVDVSTLKLSGDRDNYSVEAMALDERRTLIRVRSPGAAPLPPPEPAR